MFLYSNINKINQLCALVVVGGLLKRVGIIKIKNYNFMGNISEINCKVLRSPLDNLVVIVISLNRNTHLLKIHTFFDNVIIKNWLCCCFLLTIVSIVIGIITFYLKLRNLSPKVYTLIDDFIVELTDIIKIYYLEKIQRRKLLNRLVNFNDLLGDVFVVNKTKFSKNYFQLRVDGNNEVPDLKMYAQRFFAEHLQKWKFWRLRYFYLSHDSFKKSLKFSSS